MDEESTYDTSMSRGGGHGPLVSPFESVDLIREMATFVVDDLRTVTTLSIVSRTCRSAILDSPEVWKSVCYYRWRRKWGFIQRWQTAEAEAATSTATAGATTAADGRWWRDRYHWQEIDGRRLYITGTELATLYFDFRFWLSQFWGQGFLLSSGLRYTASQNIHMSKRDGIHNNNNHNNNENEELVFFSWPGTEWGVLEGHPSGSDNLEWFLDEDGQNLQWGRIPTLWPKGTIHRLSTWGWEIRNPNVCLRAMDSQWITLPNGESHIDCVRNNDETLWEDYLSSLRRYPTDFGMPNQGIAFIEAPDSFWSFTANRQRFPRLGIDEIIEPLEEDEGMEE